MCIYVCLCACKPHICKCLQRPEEEVGSYGSGVSGSCEPTVGDGNLRFSSAAVHVLNCRAIIMALGTSIFESFLLVRFSRLLFMSQEGWSYYRNTLAHVIH